MTERADAWAALRATDPEIASLIEAEERREHDKIRLIPSENYVSYSVLAATGSVLTNKYSEGYAGKRYYEGQQIVDPIETLAIERAKALFGAEHANVQPYSGSPCNLAAYLAFCSPGDTIMGMSLPSGGHLTHGWNVSVTGKWFRSVLSGWWCGFRKGNCGHRAAISDGGTGKSRRSAHTRLGTFKNYLPVVPALRKKTWVVGAGDERVFLLPHSH